MIKVFGRVLCVPENEKNIGFVKDNLVETRQFKITDPSLFSFSFKLELENGSVKDIVNLPRTLEDGVLILEWSIASSNLQFAGPLYAQLRAFSDSDMVWHSEIAEFTVNRSIEAETALSPVSPSEFAEMEKRATALLTATETASAAAALAAETADGAKTEAQAFSDDAATSSDAAALFAESASVSAGNASAFAESASVSAGKASASAESASVSAGKASASAESASASANSAAASQNAASVSATEAIESAAFVRETLGDMETALDSIIAMQNKLIGGDSV